VSSAGGAGNIATIYTLLNTSISATTACHITYNPVANRIALFGDTGQWSPSVLLGAAGTLSNNQCTLNTGTSSVSTSGNNLTLNLVLQFAGGWTGTKNNYLWVSDFAGQISGWGTMGTWTVQ
jgi:hypothetical protein